jgi:hypothetical protein
MYQVFRTAEEYLSLVSSIGATVTLCVLVATHEIPELYECRELRLGGLSGRIERELGT